MRIVARAYHRKRKEWFRFVVSPTEEDMKRADTISFGGDIYRDLYQDLTHWGLSSGLEDREGEEVFRGDIIKAEAWEPKHYTIDFIEGGFCATYDGAHMPIDINIFYPSTGCMFTKVGNIYDNPELLSK